MLDKYCSDCQKVTGGCGKHSGIGGWINYSSVHGIPPTSWLETVVKPVSVSNASLGSNEAMKYDKDKLRLDLLPFDALMEVAEVYSMGSHKYADRNWERGLKYMRIVGALLRHLFAWILGEERAKDDKQRHLASVVWCGLALLTYELRGMKSFDDRAVK